ncbi:MAG TPA: histidine kinase, partial [Flavobacteriales bacterium]|nr:histidine kinase [Flavobacteriales bacterium]
GEGIDWYTRSDGLTGDRVEKLLLDEHGGLWVGTNDGLCRFDRTTHAIERVHVPGSLVKNSRFSAMALDTDGSLLAAFGALIVDIPTEGTRQRVAPEVALTKMSFAGETRWNSPTDSAVELQHDTRALSIEFGVRSFFGDREVRSAYRVVDLDTNWKNLGTSTRLELNDLPIGEHRVEIRANQGGTAWSAHPLAIRVTVLPPWWSTWWFRIASTLLIALLAWAGVRYYVQGRLAEQRAAHEREQAVLNERVRIAGDMHDDLGAGLSGLKLRSEMALRVEKDPAKREQLTSLARTAGELIGSMRQIIWTMTDDQRGVEDLVVYATSYARTYCEENQLAIEVEANGPWPSTLLSAVQRRNIFLVMKEALHNTVKHAQASQVRIGIQWNDGLSVTIADDGMGLSKGTETSVGNGLRNMEKRISALGGTFTIEAAQGTLIRFHIPMGSAPNQGSIPGTDRA